MVKRGKFRAYVATLNYYKGGGLSGWTERVITCVHNIAWGDSRGDRPERRQLVSYFWVYTKVADEVAPHRP